MKGILINKESQAERLENLLAESANIASLRAAQAFNEQTRGKEIVLVGSGNLGQKILATLRKNNVEPVAFTDNNKVKWNTTLSEIPVLSPAEAAEKYKSKAAFVVCIWSPGHHYKHTKAQFQELGCEIVISCSFLFWKYPADLLPHYHFDLPQNYLNQKESIIAAFNLLADEESREQYLAHVRARLFLDLEGLPLPTGEKQYFPEDLFTYLPEEVFLDGGAFNGDTLQSFLDIYGSNFKSYIALEPDPDNFIKLSKVIADLEPGVKSKVKALPLAVGDKREVLKFDATGGGGAGISLNGSIEVQCVAIDEEFTGTTPTFIKLDVEGAERFALKGAEKLIKETQPLIAVCIYHMPDCLWNILLYLFEICPDYRFYCRTYEGDGLDFVLYAVPQSRLK